MAAITIRKLDESVKTRLRVRAASHGRSMEEEAREILSAAVAEAPAEGFDLGTAIHERFAKYGGLELETPLREPVREPPDFSGPEFDPPSGDPDL